LSSQVPKGSMPSVMMIRKIVIIPLLVLSSFAANNVAPSKTELEGMYDKAFREFDASNYEQALKDLDAIDARQPDLAESQNLRGVILMRQKDYQQAEAALQKALAADPKFWNARFNLAEIPFLEKNWAEGRKRFQDLLSGNASELQGEATQLIQYKIMITYLMEGKETMVESMLAKFELSPNTPAAHYANAAIALNKKDEKAAKDALTTAEKSFSPQLNKLFAESLYEVGWLEKPAGQTRAALELNSAAERVAKTKEFARAKFDEAEQSLQQRDLTAARKFIDEADAADPNRAQVINLRGEILLEQKEFDQAETEFKKAAKVDPKFRDAQYNLAQVPFKKKDYAKARERFESLFSTTSGVDKDRAAQLIKYKVYLTYLLEGKDSRAQKMMEQFQFTGDTPALYYAQAAWEFKHDNAPKANDWVTSARKIYPPALNGVFSDAFYDLGWLQSPSLAASPAPALADAGPAESAPTIEPTPIPAITLAKNEPAKSTDPLTLAAQANSAVPGMEATTSSAEKSPAASSVVAAASSPSVETPVASTASPAAARAVIANAPEPDATAANEEANAPSVADMAVTSSSVAASPATVLAPAKVREWSQPSMLERFGDANSLLVAALLLAAILLISWVVIPFLRRRIPKPSLDGGMSPVTSPSFDDAETVGTSEALVTPTRLAGGPPQVSLQLRASEPALRRAVMPLSKTGRAYGNGSGNGNGHLAAPVPVPAQTFVQPEPFRAPEPDIFSEGVGDPVVESRDDSAYRPPTPTEIPVVTQASPLEEFIPEPSFVPAAPEWTTAERSQLAMEELPVQEPIFAASGASDVSAEASPVFESAISEDVVGSTAPEPISAANETRDEPEEPIGQGQPIPYLTSVVASEVPVAETDRPEPATSRGEPPLPPTEATGLAGIGALRHPVENPSFAPQVVSSEPTVQPTTPATMPTPTPIAPAPVIRTGSSPTTGGAPQPASAGGMQQPASPQPAAGGMHTAVQLTFSFEIASLQLTPSFKMGALQLKPTSKIVTMRLAPSQHPQPAMNLQVTFEVATVQLTGNSIGMIRLTPSQQQRPGIISSPSFNIAGLQLVSGSESAPVQLTPSQQGQASVHVTGAFQIATVEFSPSFEIASIVLNSTSKTVSVQLPGSGPSAVEGAPTFDITNVQLAGNGEMSMMQLNPHAAGPKQG